MLLYKIFSKSYDSFLFKSYSGKLVVVIVTAHDDKIESEYFVHIVIASIPKSEYYLYESLGPIKPTK